MRVAVFGAGYAGLTVARELEETLPPDVELVVVEEQPRHLVQHELHRLIRRPDLEDAITVPLEDALSRATIRRATVADVDLGREVATLNPVDDGPGTSDGTAGEEGLEELDYDVGAICLGAETAFYDLPGVEEHAVPLKRLEHAGLIRRQALDAPGGDVVVSGAGLSGVQVAGELAELSRAEGLELDVTVVEALDRIAPGFDDAFAAAIRDELEVRGVTLETGVAVERADADAVHLADGRSLPHDVFVWTGGICGPAALDGDRLETKADLQVADGTFVVGDAGDVVDETGRTAPASAQTAIQQAEVAAANVAWTVAAALDGEESGDGRSSDGDSFDGSPNGLESYRFDAPGWVVSVGDGAVAQIGPVVLSGEAARTVKAMIGAGHVGAVGDVERACDLVAAELGWPTSKAARQFVDVTQLTMSSDAAVRRHLDSPLGPSAFALADALVPGDAIDVSGVTRLADRSYPGSPASIVERAVVGPLDAIAGAFGSRDEDGSGTDGNGSETTLGDGAAREGESE